MGRRYASDDACEQWRPWRHARGSVRGVFGWELMTWCAKCTVRGLNPNIWHYTRALRARPRRSRAACGHVLRCTAQCRYVGPRATFGVRMLSGSLILRYTTLNYTRGSSRG